MIDNNTAIQPDAIEKVICLPFHELKRHPMLPEIADTYLQICLLPKDFTIPPKEKFFLFKVIEKRLPIAHSFKIYDQRLILALCIIAESPGTAVMYLWYLQWWCKQNNLDSLNLEIFSEKIFPGGFPSKTDLQNLWDSQKLKPTGKVFYSGNLVDRIGTADLSIK